MAVAGIVGLGTYALLNISFILAGKNIAINTTHQQARSSTLNMLRDFRSAVSVPQLADDKGIPWPSPTPRKAAGIAFQKWASGPYAIKADVVGNPPSTKPFPNVIHVALLSNQTIPIYYPPAPSSPHGTYTQKLIIPTHQIEEDITGISGSKSDLSITLKNNVPVEVKGTASTGGHIVCFITDKCSYTVSNNVLVFNARGASSQKISGTSLTNATPFYLPPGPDGAAFNSLTVNDLNYSNRKYRSLQISLNGEAPMKAQLTTNQ